MPSASHSALTLRTKKNRAPITISSATYKINGVDILACGYNDSFKYLGIRFNPTGKLSSNIKELNLLLERLKKSPLKPQQKLLLLRQNVLPKLCHRLVLGHITKGLLETFDQKIRHLVRDITDLPHDTPNAFFYTSTKLGGLGIMDVKSSIPLSILKRLKKMESSNDTAVKALLNRHTIITSLQRTCVTILGCDSIVEALSFNKYEHHCNELYSTIDGKPLTEMKKNSKGQLWSSGTTSIVSGRNFKNLLKLRIGRLATLENCNRWREVDKKCCKCFRVNETMQHVIQSCHYTHFSRMARHDSIADFIKERSTKAGLTVVFEPHFDLGTEKLKPDLVIIKDDEILVIDVSIVTEHMRFRHLTEPSTLDGFWNHKVNIYRKDKLIERLWELYHINDIWFGAIIISLRGIWCSKNDITLQKCIIPLSARDTLVARCMERTVKIWNHFMRET